MSRAVVLGKLRGDTALNTLVPPANILTNYSKEGRPSNLDPGMFMILRWGDQRIDRSVNRGPRDLTIWIHCPREKSEDFTDIDSVLPHLDRILLPLEDEPGGDGYTVTDISPAGGASGDLTDPAFNTIVRTVSYEVLSRPS